MQEDPISNETCQEIHFVNAKAKKYIIVSGLRARHFKTTASMFFLNKKKLKKIIIIIKFPLFFTYKRVCKTLPNVTTLYPKTCVTDIKVAEFNWLYHYCSNDRRINDVVCVLSRVRSNDNIVWPSSDSDD